MAGGRVKDPVLKVFGNDYPTMYVGYSTCELRLTFGSAMGPACGIIFTCLTSPQATSSPWKHCRRTRRSSTTAKALVTRPTILGKAEAQAFFRSWRPCGRRPGSISNTKSSVAGKIICALEGLAGALTGLEFSRGDVPDLTADPSLAEKELGFRAPQDLETMCRDLWNWQTKNPQGYGM